jgi:hypothetical protein
MVTIGRCPACDEEDRRRDEHHIVPRRFTKGRAPKINRLDFLFPEFFSSGRNDLTDSLCRRCHQRVDRIIPYEAMLTPEKYLLLHRLFLSGEPIEKELLKIWIRESAVEIRMRQEICLRNSNYNSRLLLHPALSIHY